MRDGRGAARGRRKKRPNGHTTAASSSLHCISPRGGYIGPHSGAAGGGRERQTQSFPDLETTPAATGGGRGAERPGWGLRQTLWNFSDGRALRSRNALAAVDDSGGRVPRRVLPCRTSLGPFPARVCGRRRDSPRPEGGGRGPTGPSPGPWSRRWVEKAAAGVVGAASASARRHLWRGLFFACVGPSVCLSAHNTQNAT